MEKSYILFIFSSGPGSWEAQGSVEKKRSRGRIERRRRVRGGRPRCEVGGDTCLGSYHDATPVVSLAALRGGGQNKPYRPSRTPGARRSREARENRGTEGKAVSQRDTRGGTRRRPWLTRIARSPSKPDAARARGAEALLQEGGREPHIEMQGRKSRPLLFSSPLPTDRPTDIFSAPRDRSRPLLDRPSRR